MGFLLKQELKRSKVYLMNKLIVYQTCQGWPLVRPQVRKFMTCFARIFLIICNVLQSFANCSRNEGQSSGMCLCV